MNELYWITRLDAINTVSLIFEILSSLSVILSLLLCLTIEGVLPPKKVIRPVFKIAVPTFAISLLLQIFVPTTREALVIWGIGGTMDYLKSNEKAIQLPDKCIDALDLFINEYINERETVDRNEGEKQ